MSKNYLIPLLLTHFMLCGCGREVVAPASSVRAEFSWEGATAESIAEQLPAIAPSFKLAIIEDELATVYFDLDKNSVDAELQNTRANSPGEMAVRAIEELKTSIPAPPERVEVKRVQYEADAERMAALGVTMGDLATALKGDARSFPALEDPEEFLSVRVKNSEGNMIPVSDLGTAEAVSVQRPLVLQR